MLPIVLAFLVAGGGFVKEPPDVRSAVAVANRALVDGDRAAAVRALEPVVARTPVAARAALLYARALERGSPGRAAAASAASARAAASPDDPAAQFLAGILASDRATRDATFRRTSALAPGQVWGPLGRAIAAYEADAVADAIPLFERALAVDAREPAVLEGLATSLALVPSRRGEALGYLERLLEVAPDSIFAETAFDAVAQVVSRNDVPALTQLYLKRCPDGRRAVGILRMQTLAQVRFDEVSGAGAVRDAWARVSAMRGERHHRERGAFVSEVVLPQVLAGGPPALQAFADQVAASTEDSPEVLAAIGSALARLDPPDDARAAVLLGRALAGADGRRTAPDLTTDDLRLLLATVRDRMGATADAAALADGVRRDGTVARAGAYIAGDLWMRVGRADRAAAAYARAVALEGRDADRARLSAAARALHLPESETDGLVWSAIDRMARPAPDFSLRTLDGTPVRLSELRGRVVLVTFWFPACAPCRAEFPDLEAVRARHRDEGLEVVAIDITRDDPAARRALADLKVTFPSLTGDAAAVAAVKEAWAVTATPTGVLVDREGRAIYRTDRFEGPAGADLLERRVRLLLARRP